MSEMCKIEKDNGITQEDDICFEPSKLRIREVTIFLKLTVKKKLNWFPSFPIVENNQILKIESLDFG